MSTIDPSTLRAKILKKLKQKPYSVSKLADELGLRRDFLGGFLESMRAYGELDVIGVGVAKVYYPKNGGGNG